MNNSAYYFKGRKSIGLLGFAANVIIAMLPRILAKTICRFLVPEPDFIFFTHPRNEHDILATFPFIRAINRIIPKAIISWILQLSPCYIVSCVNSSFAKRGYIVSTAVLPSDLFASRELTNQIVRRSIVFIDKMVRREVYVGLAAWWPIVSNSGLLFKRYSECYPNIKITNGHTATVASLYLTVVFLSTLLEIPLNRLKLLIVGVGKVGGVIAELFSEKVAILGLCDKNYIRIKNLSTTLHKNHASASFDLISAPDDKLTSLIVQKAKDYDLTVCTTSNANPLIQNGDELEHCIVVDDSRPEAFPRIVSLEKKVIILEGGLIRLKGVTLDSDFGFGNCDDVFGCLAESIILALDQGVRLKPIVGDFDIENFKRMLDVLKIFSFEESVLKSGHQVVTPILIKQMFVRAYRTA